MDESGWVVGGRTEGYERSRKNLNSAQVDQGGSGWVDESGWVAGGRTKEYEKLKKEFESGLKWLKEGMGGWIVEHQRLQRDA